MSIEPTLGSELRDLYAEESARLRQEFEANGDGHAAVSGRTALVETIALRLWKKLISPDLGGPKGFALVPLGGFGRRWLFPYSDIDILFLHTESPVHPELKDSIRAFSQELWDLKLKMGATTRKLAECEKFDANNVEFSISLLDCRYLAGDRELFDRLHDQVVPRLVTRESRAIVQRLTDLSRERYNKYGNSVFDLEPNVKDGPGGLRDCNLASWLALLAAMEEKGEWSDMATLLPSWLREKVDAARDFLMSVRCFLHFQHGRDDNTLTWNSQDGAAGRRIGVRDSRETGPMPTAEWMRVYFRHARLIHRVAQQLLDEFPAARPSLYKQFQNLRSRLSNAEFAVVDGRIFLQRAEALQDPQLPLRMFRFVARHGLSLSSATEHQLDEALPALTANPPSGAALWHDLQEILLAPHAGEALRAMHSLGLLTALVPEFRLIDSLVIRDYSHRFTVDEHTFVAIENLHALRKSQSKWDQRYAELLEEVDQPDLLYLAILLHDIGKGVPSDSHVKASLDIAETCLERLDLDEADRETVRFLVRNHLELSNALRRDIFDPETIRQFAERMGTPERLKMLCLFTYADVKAVNPEALTPWKAENIWQLYIGSANAMMRSVDQRLRGAEDSEVMEHLRSMLPAAGDRLDAFLGGLPRRYLLTHTASEVVSHMEMASRLDKDPVQVSLTRGRQWFELSLVTKDRPFIFARIAGTLAAWGMNIVKASAFSNKSGVVVDTFYFTDRFETLELNLPEWDRFKTSVHEVLMNKVDLDRMLADRLRSDRKVEPKVKIETKIEIDDICSAHSTLVEVITQDRPGLLHRIATQLARENCNIEIAIIETEGQMAIDVFYVTSGRRKLAPAQQGRLRSGLLAELAGK
jgi:[protein-PII] uridylyltransferase